MKLNDYKHLFITIGLIGVLFIASPVLVELISFPSGEQFSEIFIIGSDNRVTSIPFNIKSNTSYSVYLGIGNHLDKSAYYLCYIKFRNHTDSLLNVTKDTSSLLKPLYEYRIFVPKGSNQVLPLIFSLPRVTFSNNLSFVETLRINNISVNSNITSAIDPANNCYYYQFYVELWKFEPTAQEFQYQYRDVYFWMNVTSP